MKKEVLLVIGSSFLTALLIFFYMNGAVSPSLDSTGVFRAESLSQSPKSLLSYSASLVLKVDDISPVEGAVKSNIQTIGGYLIGMSGTYGKSRKLILSFKVPSEKLDSAISELEKLGKVDEKTYVARDVKSQYDGVSARLEGLNAEKLRLLDFYKRANKTSDLVEISSRLSYVDSQLTYLNQRKAELENQVDFSVLSVTLEQKLGALSKFVLIDLSDLFSRFSSGLNAALKAGFYFAGLLLPLILLAAFALVAKITYSSLNSK